MKKLSKRTRTSGNAFSVERYASCLSEVQKYCDSQCNYYGSNPYAMGLVREDRYSYYKAIFEA